MPAHAVENPRWKGRTALLWPSSGGIPVRSEFLQTGDEG